MADLITGPGRYPRRDGGVAVIQCRNSQPGESHEWVGDFEGSRTFGLLPAFWMADGSFFSDRSVCDYDIVGPRLPEEAALGLEGQLQRERAKNEWLARDFAWWKARAEQLEDAIQSHGDKQLLSVLRERPVVAQEDNPHA